MLFIYRLLSRWFFQYTLLSIEAESRPLFFPKPPGGIAYVNPIFALIYIFLPLTPRPPRPPIPRPPLPSNRPPLPPLPHIQYEFTYRLCTYITDDGWVAGKSRDKTVDKYVEAVLKLALWLDLHILTSVFKYLFGILMLSNSCLTLSSSYRGTL